MLSPGTALDPKKAGGLTLMVSNLSGEMEHIEIRKTNIIVDTCYGNHGTTPSACAAINMKVFHVDGF